jgi:sirohydrochlorin cobaltochelatase
VILVGHGPVDDQANAVWLQTMASLARQVQSKAGFKNVESATIRDDSPKAVKAQAAETLRDLVVKAGQDGEVLVIPYLISAGDIQSHIKKILQGLKYRWNGKALCPDPEIRRWALEVSAKAAAQPNMVQYQND